MNINITELKVFQFESGAKECVIARSYDEAYNYYKEMIGEEYIKEFNIEELENWYDNKVWCEEKEIQEDGTYLKARTMVDIAKELYMSGYTGAEIVSSTEVH